ncbi:MAG: phage terminase large subunit family protein [Alphaproteobacteria bacterium]
MLLPPDWPGRIQPRPSTPRSAIDGLPDGASIWWTAFRRGIQRPPRQNVAEWAECHRIVSADSGSPHPGPWKNARAPYLTEIMEVLSFDHPAVDVVFKKSHQIGGTETAMNLILYCIDHRPAPILYVLPSLDTAKRFVKTKLNPSIEATPVIRRKVREQKSRDEDGSTTSFKKFSGGYMVITGANSSKDLKMVSARVLILDEVTEFPRDVDEQGDPVSLAEKRTTAYQRTGAKRFYLSTPGQKGTCRVSMKYEASDQRRLYVPCPHCGDYHMLKWSNLHWRSDVPPYGAHFVCPGCGSEIEPRHKGTMVASGVWIKTYPEDGSQSMFPAVFPPADLARHRARPSNGRQPGFHLWQAYSLLVDWDEMVRVHMEAKGHHAKEKDFIQQVLGEDYEEAVDVPDAEVLVTRVQSYRLGTLPHGVLFTTGAADVQHNRIEWAIYGWGVGLTSWLVDKGVIECEPAEPSTWWTKMDAVVNRRYTDALGRKWPIDAFGIDTGYLSSVIYRWCARHAGSERVFALDGRGAWRLPPIGQFSVRDVDWEGRKVGSVLLYPVGTYDQKSELYVALRKTLDGPDRDGRWPAGVVHFPDACDLGFFRQLTAEHLRRGFNKLGGPVLEWAKRQKDQPNEALDIAVYARALAHHASDDKGPEEWAELIARRSAEPEQAQLDLSAYWSGLIVSPDEIDDGARQDRSAITRVPEPWATPPMSAWIDADRRSGYMRR